MATSDPPGSVDTGPAEDTDGDEVEEITLPCGVVGYFVSTFLLNAVICASAILLLSGMGIGTDVLKMLQDNAGWSRSCGGVCCLILLVLYLLDFFSAPHLPGKTFRLWMNDFIVGRLVLAVAAVFMVLACLLMADQYPSIPTLFSIFLLPVGAALIRLAFQPRQQRDVRVQEIIEGSNLEQKIQLLKRITGQEADIISFFKACTATFLLSFLGSLAAWIVWAVIEDRGLEALNDAKTQTEKDKLYILWSNPLIVAIANLVFGIFAFLRLFMQRAYSRTDTQKNKIVADCMRTSLVQEMTDNSMEVLKKARVTRVQTVESGSDLTAKREQYLTQHAQHVKQLSMIVKLVGCLFILLLGLLYVAGQLLYANSHIASMVTFILGAFFFIFAVGTYISFRRIVRAMGKSLADLPAWQTAKRATESDWSRAFVFCPALPMIPFALALSAVNQSIRKCRGIYKASEGTSFEAGDDTRCLTPRFNRRLDASKQWNWLSVTMKCYVLCLVYMCYTMCPPLLNVVLSWMNKVLAVLDFWVIVIAVFAVGVVAFLLPPVPGMTVYIFGGLVISGACPPKNTDQGFWTGAAINIGVCWLLKLVACAIQQKCIGGLLGQSTWVRQTVGVHKVGIRCIEAVLRKKGWTIGKVAILCGGPDWPTSVLAGVLNLSLVQCELGTVPIIFFVMPCALSGSLYLKKGESEVMANSANLMIVASLMVSLTLWALAAWAMQNQLEVNYHELTRPLPENIDLEWLDHKAAEIEKTTRIAWAGVPMLVRGIFLFGALVHIMVCQAFYWQYAMLVGDFQVSDPIDTLVMLGWTTKDALFTYLSILVIAVYMVSWIFLFQFSCWRRRKTGAARKAAARELDLTEAAWKEAWLKDAEEKANPKPTEEPETVEREMSQSIDAEEARTSTSTAHEKEDSKDEELPALASETSHHEPTKDTELVGPAVDTPAKTQTVRWVCCKPCCTVRGAPSSN